MGPDDTIVFASSAIPGLMEVSAAGGEPRSLTMPADGEAQHRWPSFVPGRRAVVYTVGPGSVGPSNKQVRVLSLETCESETLVQGTSATATRSGHLVFAREASLWAVPFDTDALTVTGEPAPLVEGVQVNPGGNWAHYAVADDGTLVFLPSATGGVGRTLVWVDRDGREDLIPLNDLPPGLYQSVDVSPDGTRLALESGAPRETDVWIFDLERGTLNPVTTDPAPDTTPLWTPDGRQVVFGSARGGFEGLYRQNADGTGEAEPLITDDEAVVLIANAWSAEGDALVVMKRSNQQNDLMLLSMEDEPALELLLDSDFNETRAAVSPNGDWIAYESDRSGTSNIYVERFPGLGDRQPISTDGGQQPRWSPDGRELFYLGPAANRLMVVSVTTETGLSVGTPETLVEAQFFDSLGRSAYDVAPDGRLVLIRRVAGTSGNLSASASGVIRSNDATSQITVVLNWFEELKERVPLP